MHRLRPIATSAAGRLFAAPARSMSELLKVILVQDYPALGIKGQKVDVKPGYARNLLVPRKVAVYATRENAALYKDDIAAAEATLAAEAAAAAEAHNVDTSAVSAPAVADASGAATA